MKKTQSIPQSDLYGKNLEELHARRLEVEEGIRGCEENAALADSAPGQKLIKRLSVDLDAIRRKYAFIKGNAEEQLAVLHRLQGREQQVGEELSNLKSAADARRNLGLQLEAITFAIGERKKDTGSR